MCHERIRGGTEGGKRKVNRFALGRRGGAVLGRNHFCKQFRIKNSIQS